MTRTVALRALAAFVALHGVAHLAGTTDLFGRAADGRAAELLFASPSDPLVLRALGVAWAVVAVAYVAVAISIWVRSPRWPALLGWTTAVSLALAIVALWATVIGALIDVALLALVLARRR